MASMYRLYRRPDRTGGTYYIDYHLDGRRRRKSLDTTVYKEAKERAAEEIARREEADRLKQRKDLPVTEFLAQYKALVVGKAPGSIQQEETAWKAFETEFKGRTMASIRQAEANMYRAILARGRQPRTVNSTIGRLSGLYTFALEHGIITGQNPFRGVKRLKEPVSAPKFITESDLEKVISAAHAHSERIYLFCALCAFAGLRTKEAISARWHWIDFEHGTLTVKGGSGFTAKSGRERTLPLHPRLRLILSDRGQSDSFIIAPELNMGKWRLRYEPKRAFASVAIAAGLYTEETVTVAGETVTVKSPTLTPHMLRHTFASLLVQKGVSLEKVSQWLGHADYATTRIYAHLAPQDDEIGVFGVPARAAG